MTKILQNGKVTLKIKFLFLELHDFSLGLFISV